MKFWRIDSSVHHFFLYETYRHWNENCWVQGLGSRLSEQSMMASGNLSLECRKLLTTRVVFTQNAKHDLLTFTRQSSTMVHLLRVKICWWRQTGWKVEIFPCSMKRGFVASVKIVTDREMRDLRIRRRWRASQLEANAETKRMWSSPWLYMNKAFLLFGIPDTNANANANANVTNNSSIR